jgi:hypothetical protein
VSIDRRSADAELGGDLPDGVSALAVVACFVVHLARERDLSGAKLGFLAAGAPAGARGDEPVERAFRHQRVLEFCARTEDLEEHPAHRPLAAFLPGGSLLAAWWRDAPGGRVVQAALRSPVGAWNSPREAARNRSCVDLR